MGGWLVPLMPPQVILNQIDKTLVMAATSQASAERISTLQDAFCGMLSTAITKLLSQEDSKGALLPLADKASTRSTSPHCGCLPVTAKLSAACSIDAPARHAIGITHTRSCDPGRNACVPWELWQQ